MRCLGWLFCFATSRHARGQRRRCNGSTAWPWWGNSQSGLAHEIGTPLSIIGGNADFLRMQWRDQGVATVELDAIIEQTERITRLIERLLTFARPENEPMTPVMPRSPWCTPCALSKRASSGKRLRWLSMSPRAAAGLGGCRSARPGLPQCAGERLACYAGWRYSDVAE